MKRAREDYERDITRNAKESPKVFHCFFKVNLKVKEQILKLKRTDGSITETAEEICEEMNKKFQSVFTAENTSPHQIADIGAHGPVLNFGLTNVTRAVIPIPYWDAFGAGYILSICLPLTHNSTFMGTSCIDFSIFNLLGSHTSIDDIKDAYVFIVSSLGNTLLHPLLPSPASLSQDPSYVTIENLEQSHNVKSLLGKMIAQEHGKEDVNGMEIYSLGKPEGTNFPNPVKISRHELRYLWGPIQETELTIALVLPLQEGKVLSSSYKCKGECHTADFEYNLPKPGKDRKLCNLSGKIIMENRNKGLLKFAPSCFIDVLSYIKKESHKQILDLYNIFNNPQPHDELLKKNLRPSVQLLKTAEKLWREQQSTNANLSKHTSGRYMGTSGGAFISFPGTPLKQQYDHRTTPWFHKARSTNGKRLISMTMPYCGKWGEDMMYTITNTLHDPAGNPVAVVAGDLPFQYILNDFRNQVPKCLSHTCLIVDHLGYVVLQSDWAAINSSRDSCTNDTKVSDHLVKRAPDIAQDMIASKILKRRVCNDYQNDTTFYYWTLGFSGHRTLHQGSTYKVYKLPQTNLYIIIRTAAKSRSKCNCPPVKQGSKEVMCYDTCALECECPCIAGPDTRPCQNETIDLHRYPVPACKPHGLVTVSPKFKSEDNIKNCS
ncbi:hypothetical protein SK128_020401 [Halocaridina rubra]|uniref:Uncharacterized protein n=1 Tax=Halocaridina rubra TaxID=373956 RepID=A0AAN8WFG2_HALRR